MDYEKAYKAVLKTAKQWIKDGCTDKEKICLECVFPELRESEDERIRKWLVDYFGSIKEVVWIHRDITCEQILEWLEKQKKQKPIRSCDIVPYIDDKIAALQDMWREEKVAFDWDDMHEMIEDVARHFYQKEQTPAWSEEDKRRIDAICELLENTSAIHPNYSHRKLIIWLKSLRPSWKPSEKQMNCLCAAVDAAIRKHNESVSGYEPARVLKSLYEDLKKL